MKARNLLPNRCVKGEGSLVVFQLLVFCFSLIGQVVILEFPLLAAARAFAVVGFPVPRSDLLSSGSILLVSRSYPELRNAIQ